MLTSLRDLLSEEATPDQTHEVALSQIREAINETLANFLQCSDQAQSFQPITAEQFERLLDDATAMGAVAS